MNVSLIAAVAAAVLVAGVATGPAAYADPNDDRIRVDRQLAETRATLEAATDRAQQAAADLAGATAALPLAEVALAEAQGRVIGAEANARQADRDAQEARVVEARANGEYGAAMSAVDSAREDATSFVNAAYKGSGLLAINSILDSGNPADFATRLGYLNRVAAHQEQELDELTGARMLARQQRDVTLLARERAVKSADAARLAHEAALSARTAAEQAAARVRALIEQRTLATAVAEQERSAVLARYAELKAESDRIANELRSLRAGQRGRGGVVAPPRDGGAFFLTPVRGWKSSNFGMRYDPYYHVWQLHAGVDIAAGGGAPIFASADGRVMRAGWAGGYGRYTCLYHGEYEGEGLATCYAHQSQIDVNVGQQVRRGQLIGRVGTTGASTGYHLHFEVRVDGNPVNPLGWLASCLC